MPPIRPVGEIASKWRDRAAQSTGDYKRGVENPRQDWAERTANAQDNYNAGVQQAISAGRFAAGVRAAGTEKWKRNTAQKGPDRWLQGISLSTDNYARGFRPFAEVIQNTSLPPRGPRGSTQNYERARAMGEALHNARVT